MGLAWGWATDTGVQRCHNEDAVLAEDPVFVIADGVGGRAAGEVASSSVVQAFSGLVTERVLLAADDVSALLASVDQDIRQRSTTDPRNKGMATTAVGMVAIPQYGIPYWLAFNIGDSRLYRSHGTHLEQISVDHSYVQELVDSGQLTPAQVKGHPERSVITRALGAAGSRHPDFWLFPAEVGQRFLLCSDGLTDEVDDSDISTVLAGATHPQVAADALVTAAVRAGTKDNVSVVVVDVRGQHGQADHPTVTLSAIDESTDGGTSAPTAGRDVSIADREI
jgi:PPM family protein phosphatase